MTFPSQFSLEEENFYKDIQDLLKNSSQNGKELSSFLQRYMDLLAKADLDEESFFINFTKAGLIIEASARVYGTKVDRLWSTLEHLLTSLRNKNQGQSKNKTLVGEEVEIEGDENKRRLSMSGRKKKKVGDALMSPDDFIEIDNVTGLLGKNMNESVNKKPGNLKFCEKVPNMFIKNKQKKKKIDVCLNKNVEEKDTIRLRDWVISTECLLVKEIFMPIPVVNSTNDTANESFGFRRQAFDFMALDKSCVESESIRKNIGETSEVELLSSSTPKENLRDKNSDVEPPKSIKEPNCISSSDDDNIEFPEGNAFAENDLNISKESDLAKFPNVLGGYSKACLVDVDEVFWNSEKFQDMIPSKKLRSGKAYKIFNPPCKLCKRKDAHQGKKPGRRCLNKKRKDSGLDSYFIPHVQPTVSEPQFGILPDVELISTFKQENKIIEKLSKVNAARNINEAFHPNENPEELKNFLGFDGFEKNLIGMSEYNEEEVEVDFGDNNPEEEPNFLDNPPLGEDFELPVPVTENLNRHKNTSINCDPGPKDDDRLAEFEYQNLVKKGLKDHFVAKSVFAKNKELGIKISKWHDMISDKIKLSEFRGAMNMNLIANKIMGSFPSPLRGELPQMSFRQLVKNECRRDVPRYFFGCLQLTNEGNVDIRKTDSRPLATDCMMIIQLRSMRKNCDLDESTARTPTRETKSLEGNKKRSARKRSPISCENKSPSKTKRRKQKKEAEPAAPKRQKNFISLNNSKKISTEQKNAIDVEEPKECEKVIQIVTVVNEDENVKVENTKRQKKTPTLASDFFQEINISVFPSEKKINETPEDPKEVKFYNDVFKIFIKNKTKKKKFFGNKHFRLKDWNVTKNCLLVKGIGTLIQERKLIERNKKPSPIKVTIPTYLLKEMVKKSKTKELGLRQAEKKPSNLTKNVIHMERKGVIVFGNHNYLKKPNANSKLKGEILSNPQEKNPVPESFTRRNYDEGPSNAYSVPEMSEISFKRLDNLNIPKNSKKLKLSDLK